MPAMDRRPRFYLLTIATLALAATTQARAAASDPERFAYLPAAQLVKELGAADLRVFDANSLEVWRKGHVPGAVHVSYAEVGPKVLPTDKSVRLVFYCKDTQCTASHRDAERAAELGYQHVFVMPEGIDGWVAQGRPVEKGSPPIR